MLFRDAKLKIQQAAMSDFIVRRIMDTRAYMEREQGVPISDEDFYAALAVAMMESRENMRRSYQNHLATCISNRHIVPHTIKIDIDGTPFLEPIQKPTHFGGVGNAVEPLFTQEEMRQLNSVFPGSFQPVESPAAIFERIGVVKKFPPSKLTLDEESLRTEAAMNNLGGGTKVLTPAPPERTEDVGTAIARVLENHINQVAAAIDRDRAPIDINALLMDTRPPSPLHPLVMQDERDRKAVADPEPTHE